MVSNPVNKFQIICVRGIVIYWRETWEIGINGHIFRMETVNIRNKTLQMIRLR
jgi:hypothetical protein